MEANNGLVPGSGEPLVTPSPSVSHEEGGSPLFGRHLLYVVILASQLIAATVVSPIVAHVMGPVEFGALATAIALHQMLGVLALVGIDKALVLQRAEDSTGGPSQGLVTVGITISLGVCLLFGVTAPLWRDALGVGDNPALATAVLLWTFPTAAVQVMLALLLTEDRIRPFCLVSVIAAIGGQVGGIALLFTVDDNATTYIWGGVASQFAAMAIAMVATRPKLRGLLAGAVAWKAIRLGIPLALSGMAYFVLEAGDRIIIRRELGAAEVGRYQIAYVVGSVVILLLVFTGYAWSPRFAEVRDKSKRWALAAQSRDSLYRLLIPAILGITLAAPMTLRIVAPPSFQPSSLTVVVFVVALAAFPVAASGATGQLLITLRRGKAVGLVTGAAAVANVVLNLLLVPIIGIVGAAIATLAAYMLLAFVQRRVLPAVPVWRKPPVRLVIGIAAAISVSAASLLLPQSLPWNVAQFAVAVACLPWFLLNLARARRGPSEGRPLAASAFASRRRARIGPRATLRGRR